MSPTFPNSYQREGKITPRSLRRGSGRRKVGGNLRTREESAEKPRAQRGKKRKLKEGEGKERRTEAQAGGVGRGRARSSPEWGGGEARPPEGRGGRRRTDGGSRWKAGVEGACGRGLPRTPPPPFTQRGPGTPLPALAAEPARACVLRSSLCCPDGSLGRGSRGRRPALLSALARPPGRLCHAKAMAIGRVLGLTAAPALRLAEGKGAGAVRRRRPLGLQANPPLLFLTPTPPNRTHPEGFP
ncbi:uncharacterized protein LOC132481509 [Mesoplodon densirostris]|uniref:uncharacterized protein LOC132481509 n=1 Tax=Mesoplodon densirostris TaxID=48708 RepID=UPI0028DB10F1|nr:uncharacterized protein LOC132481509 [Mesoplodon densirostris]